MDLRRSDTGHRGANEDECEASKKLDSMVTVMLKDDAGTIKKGDAGTKLIKYSELCVEFLEHSCGASLIFDSGRITYLPVAVSATRELIHRCALYSGRMRNRFRV